MQSRTQPTSYLYFSKIRIEKASLHAVSHTITILEYPGMRISALEGFKTCENVVFQSFGGMADPDRNTVCFSSHISKQNQLIHDREHGILVPPIVAFVDLHWSMLEVLDMVLI